jgi:hypothetical protein
MRISDSSGHATEHPSALARLNELATSVFRCRDERVIVTCLLREAI